MRAVRAPRLAKVACPRMILRAPDVSHISIRAMATAQHASQRSQFFPDNDDFPPHLTNSETTDELGERDSHGSVQRRNSIRHDEQGSRLETRSCRQTESPSRNFDHPSSQVKYATEVARMLPLPNFQYLWEEERASEPEEF